MGMTRKRAALAATVISLLVVGVVAGVVVLHTGGDSPPPSHASYAEMYEAAIPGRTKISSVENWPRPPDQSYHDNFNDQCYQWRDPHVALYNLCFRHGTLAFKEVE
jgi:hypothetical protein